MGWETRRGRRYFYRKERTPDGVRSVYVGPASEPLARFYGDTLEDEARMGAARRRIHARTFGPMDDALGALLASERRLRALRDSYLAACGYRRHRGQWRRQRGLDLDPFTPWTHTAPEGAGDMAKAKKKPAPVAAGTRLEWAYGTTLEIPEGTSPETLERLGEAVNALEASGRKWDDVARLREAFAELPAEAFGEFASAITRRSVAGLVSGIDTTATKPRDGQGGAVALAEAEIDRRAAALTEETDGPLVAAAVRHAVLAEAVLDAVTERYARALRGGYSFVEADNFERRLSAAQLRHVRALATVAKLREVAGKEQRRAEHHGLQMDAARRALPVRRRDAVPPPPRDARRADLDGLPARLGASLGSPEAAEIASGAAPELDR